MDYLEQWTSRSGLRLGLRRIMASDASQLCALIAGLTQASRYQRFHGDRRTLSPRELRYLVEVDFRRHHAFVVCALCDGIEILVAEVRCAALADKPGRVEYAVTVADLWQRQGIGRRCMEFLIRAATRDGYTQLEGEVLPSNVAMLGLARSLGFACTRVGGQLSTTGLVLCKESPALPSRAPAAQQISAFSN